MKASRKSSVADTIPFNNVVERAMRPIALGRKNHLFAGSDEGGRYWAIHASLIETCKMNDVDPQAWLADVLDKIANRHPMSKIDELLPWAYTNNRAKRQAA
jgi:transposase